MRSDAIYARYSSHAQDGGTSIEVQLEHCRRIAPGATPYIDQAKTGRALAGRDAMLRLLDDARAGKLGRLIVYKFDRLGRSLADTATIIADLEDAGIEVISATEGRESLSRGVHLVISEHYSKALAERTREGQRVRHIAGGWAGGPPPYGYSIIKDAGSSKLVIDSAEAEMVRWMFQTYATSPAGAKAIAMLTRQRGYQTRHGRPWAHATIRAILRNPIYTGRIRWGVRAFRLNRATGRRLPRLTGSSIDRQEEGLRIIPDALWNTAQGRARGRYQRHEYRGERTTRIFTGLLFCECCGSAMVCQKSKNSKGEYRAYRCGKRSRCGVDTCSNGRGIREDRLIGALDQRLTEGLDLQEYAQRAAQEAQRMLEADRGAIDRLQTELLQVERRLESLITSMTDPAFDAGARSAVGRELSKMEARRVELTQGIAKYAHRQSVTAEQVMAIAREMIDKTVNLIRGEGQAAANRWLADNLGPMVAGSDGRVKMPQKGDPLLGRIAGEVFAPLRFIVFHAGAIAA